MNRILFELGPITIYWYSVTMLLSVLTGIYLAIKESKKHPLIVYYRHDTNRGKDLVHYTVADRDMGVIRAYLKARKENG